MPVTEFSTKQHKITARTQAGLLPARTVAGVLLLFAIAAVVSALSTLPLAFDGSHYLLKLAQKGFPCCPHGRFGAAFFQLPAWAALNYFQTLHLPSALFCLAYSIVPALSVTASWIVVRCSHPHLIIWPVMFISLCTLPAQTLAISENLIACQLAMPLFLLCLTGKAIQHRTAVFLLAIFLTILHPVSIIIVPVCAAVLAMSIKCIDDKEDRGAAVSLCGLTMALAIMRLAAMILLSNDYEKQTGSLAALFEQVGYMSSSACLWAPVLVCAAALVLVKTQFRLRLPSLFVYALCLASATASIIWAHSGEHWQDNFAYCRFLFLPLFFFFWAALQDRTQQTGQIAPRRNLALFCAILFVAGVSHQSLIWHGCTTYLADNLSAKNSGIIIQEEQDWLEKTALNHWSLPSLSIVQQGFNPRNVIIPRDGLVKNGLHTGLKLTSWDREFENNRFNLPSRGEKH